VQRITVSRRSQQKSSALQAKFPHLVHVVEDNNQAILDAADLIFLTVLPEQTVSVLQELAFDPARHTLVSLVSTARLDDLRAHSKLPSAVIYKMICLPAVAYNEGVCLLQRAASSSNKVNEDDVENLSSSATTQQQQQQQQEATLYNLLDTLGGVVWAETDEQMAALMVPTGLMGSFYGVLRNNRDWLVRQSNDMLSQDKAAYVIARYYYGMMQDAARQCGTCEQGASAALDRLIAEQTPGGLNEQGLANLEQLGVMESYDRVQDAIWGRITGKSDGSVV